MAPGKTVKVVEVLETPPLVAVMVFNVPARVRVTDCELNTPVTKLPVGVPAVMVEFVVSTVVPVKSVTVVFVASRAVILMLNAVPEVWVSMFPPPTFSMRKLLSGRVSTVMVFEFTLVPPPFCARTR